MPAPYDLYDYTKFWEGRRYEDKAEKGALGKLINEIKDRGSFIDVGGGFGRLTAYVAGFFDHGMLVDPSKRNIETAKKYLKDKTNLAYLVGGLPNLKVDSNNYDLTIMIRVSHHLPVLDPVIKELKRITKPGGYIILEVANKVNYYARVQAMLRGDHGFSNDLTSVDRKSSKSKRERSITFVNHHPKEVIRQLQDNQLSVIKILSVSNFRSVTIKRVVPLPILLFLEKHVQSLLGKMLFGPSIFILIRKNTN